MMKKTKLLFTLLTLFTVFAFSSCTDLEEKTEFIENAEYPDGNDLFLRKRPGRK